MKSRGKSTTKVIAFYLLMVLFAVSAGCIQRGKENKGEAKSMPQDSVRTEAVASPVQPVISEEPKEKKTNMGPGALTMFTTGNMIYQYMDDDSSLNVALECYSEAIKIDPEFKEAYFNRGLVKHDLRQYKGAIADFTKAIELDPYDTAAYCFRGILKNDLKNYTEAITDFNRALQLNPDFEEAYFNRGIALIKLGQKENGCQDFKKALELGWTEASEAIEKYCK